MTLTREQLQRMSPTAIMDAYRAGEIDHLTNPASMRWDALKQAETDEQRTEAVMALSEMVFGQESPPMPMPRRRREHRTWGGDIIKVTQE